LRQLKPIFAAKNCPQIVAIRTAQRWRGNSDVEANGAA
jgi:hypothetical protein